jgi:hypothetical protein
MTHFSEANAAPGRLAGTWISALGGTDGTGRWPGADDFGTATSQGDDLRDTAAPMDRSQVCAIVAETAAQVLAEIRAGNWHPPARLRAGHGQRLA